MDKIFEYIEQDMKVMLAVAALCAVIAILALWKVVADLRRRLYGKTQRLSVSYVERTPKGEILSALVGDIDGIRNFLFGGAVDFVYSVISIVLVVAVLVRDRPFVAVLADMIEGVIVVNRLVPPDADTIRTALWESLVDAGFVGDDLDAASTDTRVA